MNKHKLQEAVTVRKQEIEQSDSVVADFQTLLATLPQGIKKQLLKNKTCAVILEKYGVMED